MRALVLGGGGSKGAFSVGAIEVLRDAGVTWDLILGCSTGALIAPMVALAQAGDVQAWPDVVGLYSTVTNDEIYMQRSLLDVIMGHHSLYDSAPLWERITSMITLARYTMLCISAVPVYLLTTSMQQGLPVYWTQTQSAPLGDAGIANQSLPYAHFTRAMLASASQPVLFPLVEICEDHQQYCDGGVTEVIPLKLPIALGADMIDVIALSPEAVPAAMGVYTTFAQTLERTLSVLIDSATLTDMAMAQMINRMLLWQQNIPHVPVVNPLEGKHVLTLQVIRPKNVLTENSLDFNPIAMGIMMELGRDAAREVLESMPVDAPSPSI